MLVPLAVVVGSLVGVGTALAVNDRADEQPIAHLTPEDCASGQISGGSVLSLAPSGGGMVETAPPSELAERYIEDTKLRADFPDVTTDVQQESEKQATVSILSEGKAIGQLTYVQSEGSWRADTVQVCAPGGGK